MQTYNLTNLPTNLQGWMNTRFLEPILDIEGGWEYWMQIDFPAWLDSSTGQQWDFRREVPVGNVRLDWAINTTGLGQKTGVNLKAQTPKYLTNKFLADVAIDVQKLQTLPNGYNQLMIAAAVDNAAINTLTQTNGFVPMFQYNNEISFLYWQPA